MSNPDHGLARTIIDPAPTADSDYTCHVTETGNVHRGLPAGCWRCDPALQGGLHPVTPVQRRAYATALADAERTRVRPELDEQDATDATDATDDDQPLTASGVALLALALIASMLAAACLGYGLGLAWHIVRSGL